uniref:RRM domain-containing protein n=1 Tax=Arcella intermedia TaxID=1963864 RepID=A0A6B2LD96_9EUKA
MASSVRRSEEEFKSLFSAYGSLKRCDIKKAFAHVEFNDPRDAERAFNELDGVLFKKSRLNLEWSKAKPVISEADRKAKRKAKFDLKKKNADKRRRLDDNDTQAPTQTETTKNYMILSNLPSDSSEEFVKQILGSIFPSQNSDFLLDSMTIHPNSAHLEISKPDVFETLTQHNNIVYAGNVYPLTVDKDGRKEGQKEERREREEREEVEDEEEDGDYENVSVDIPNIMLLAPKLRSSGRALDDIFKNVKLSQIEIQLDIQGDPKTLQAIAY